MRRRGSGTVTALGDLMGFYIRKAFRLGPLRFNLSKSGLGVSAGVKGARISTGPAGTQIHAGRHGLYYRKRLRLRKRTATAGPPVVDQHTAERRKAMAFGSLPLAEPPAPEQKEPTKPDPGASLAAVCVVVMIVLGILAAVGVLR
jgi:hypothetical protein